MYRRLNEIIFEEYVFYLNICNIRLIFASFGKIKLNKNIKYQIN